MTPTPDSYDMSDEELAALVNPGDPQSELESLRAIDGEELAREQEPDGERTSRRPQPRRRVDS